MLGLHFCARAFSTCGRRGPLFIAMRGPLTVAASLVAEHRLQTRRLSSCGSRAQLLRGMWDLPRPGREPRVPCISRQILNHCATREALLENFLTSASFFKPLLWLPSMLPKDKLEGTDNGKADLLSRVWTICTSDSATLSCHTQPGWTDALIKDEYIGRNLGAELER